MMEDFKIKTASKREVKERLAKYIKAQLDLKEELRSILGDGLGNRMYEDCMNKVKRELNK